MISKILDKISGGRKVDPKEQQLLEDELERLISQAKQPDLRVIGLFSDVTDNKIAELIHVIIDLDEVNAITRESKPIEFYIST